MIMCVHMNMILFSCLLRRTTYSKKTYNRTYNNIHGGIDRKNKPVEKKY